MPATQAFADWATEIAQRISDDPFTPPRVLLCGRDVTDSFWPEWDEQSGWTLTTLCHVVADQVETRAGRFNLASGGRPVIYQAGVVLPLRLSGHVGGI